MKKYVIETWFRIEKVFDSEGEAQKYADNSVKDGKNYKDTLFITLTDGVSSIPVSEKDSVEEVPIEHNRRNNLQDGH